MSSCEIFMECILEEDHYLHEVEDEVRRADECPGPEVADPHGVGVGLHGAADVGGAVQCWFLLPNLLERFQTDINFRRRSDFSWNY